SSGNRCRSPVCLVAGETVTVTDNGNSANTMSGTVASYDAGTGTLTVNVTSTTGSGSSGGWVVAPFGKGTLNVVANTVDLVGNLSVLGARTTPSMLPAMFA